MFQTSCRSSNLRFFQRHRRTAEIAPTLHCLHSQPRRAALTSSFRRHPIETYILFGLMRRQRILKAADKCLNKSLDSCVVPSLVYRRLARAGIDNSLTRRQSGCDAEERTTGEVTVRFCHGVTFACACVRACVYLRGLTCEGLEPFFFYEYRAIGAHVAFRALLRQMSLSTAQDVGLAKRDKQDAICGA
jgi:hypothetical protein